LTSTTQKMSQNRVPNSFYTRRGEYVKGWLRILRELLSDMSFDDVVFDVIVPAITSFIVTLLTIMLLLSSRGT
jgi:hypothetical protein